MAMFVATAASIKPSTIVVSEIPLCAFFLMAIYCTDTTSIRSSIEAKNNQLSYRTSDLIISSRVKGSGCGSGRGTGFDGKSSSSVSASSSEASSSSASKRFIEAVTSTSDKDSFSSASFSRSLAAMEARGSDARTLQQYTNVLSKCLWPESLPPDTDFATLDRTKIASFKSFSIDGSMGRLFSSIQSAAVINEFTFILFS
mmetsp:Transcript_23687/g.58066  ORF Transcript_23687/g.58066 Transcript_23687/m.58066 type:complete len:200 (-) Transcript_23687:274-873(-)